MTSIIEILGLTPRGQTLAFGLASAGLLFSIAVNLVRMHILVRTPVILMPPAAGFIYVLAEAPNNLGGIAWLFMFAVAAGCWIAGCFLGIVLRRVASDS